MRGRNRETEKQRNRETEKQRNRETEKQGIRYGGLFKYSIQCFLCCGFKICTNKWCNKKTSLPFQEMRLLKLC
jgi:hypothetical protein